MNVPIRREAQPVYRCPDDGSITELCVCPKCGQVLGVSDDTI